MLIGLIGSYFIIAHLPDDYTLNVAGALFTKRTLTVALLIGTSRI